MGVIKRMKKPYWTVVYYSGASILRKKLQEVGAIFTESLVLSEFWGTEFRIEKPRGKGTMNKIREINEIFAAKW